MKPIQCDVPGLEVRGAGSHEDVVGVPVEAVDGGADGLLDVLAHPPVVLLLKVTHRDGARAAANCKLVLCTKQWNKLGSRIMDRLKKPLYEV